jgi:hypothetical protein
MAKFVVSDHSNKLNQLKNGWEWRGTPMSHKDLRKMLKDAGFPSNGTFWTAFKNSKKILNKLPNGKYTWKQSGNILVADLMEVYEGYQTLTKMYAENSRKKAKAEPKQVPATKKEEKPTKKEENTPKNNEEQAAIELLKGLGYCILKPIGVLYDKL